MDDTQTIEAPVETGTAEPQVKTDGEEQLSKDNYTKDEVSKLISGRVNKLNEKYSSWGELEKMGLTAQQIREAYEKGRTQSQSQKKVEAPTETEEEKKVRDYMEKVFPGISSVKEMQNAMQFMFQARADQITRSNTEILRGVAKESGIADEFFDDLNDLVSNSIAKNKQDLVDYQRTGDMSIVKKHFEIVKKKLSSINIQNNADLLKRKEKTNGLPPRFPQGGVPAPTSDTKKMNKQELMNAAFERIKQG